MCTKDGDRAVWSRSTLFAQTGVYENLGSLRQIKFWEKNKYMQNHNLKNSKQKFKTEFLSNCGAKYENKKQARRKINEIYFLN